jgi:hypothetical protein
MAQEDSTKTKESPRHVSQPSGDEKDGDENDIDGGHRNQPHQKRTTMNTSQNRTMHRFFSTTPMPWASSLQTPAQKKKTKTKSSAPYHHEPIDMPGARNFTSH